MSSIRRWLSDLGLGHYTDLFESNRVDVDVLKDLTDQDLKDLEVPLGDRKRILKAAADTEPSPTDDPHGTTAEGPLHAERRQITVIFCDLVGSTALSKTLDPEELRALMGGYRKACADVIERYDGHVAQYLGDGVMVYFGWPIAHEDDAGRAVRAGLDVVDAVAALTTDTPLQIRVGIATGLVVVGEGEGEAGGDSELAIGETPNVAARVQAMAEPGTVAIAQTTRRLLGGTFTLADLGTRDAKGISGGLQVHRVLGEAPAESRFEASRGLALTPLVGRESEIALFLDRWDQARDGEGQVALLSGEAGIGKSRLLQVLVERLTDEPHARLRYQCSPYYTNSAFYPIIDQLERAAGFAREDDPERKLDKLETILAQGTDDVAAVAPLIAGILSLPVDRYPALARSPQRQKDDTIAALAAQVAGLARAEPLLVLFEDAHWCDPTTIEVLGAVIDAIREARVLLVITHRPEFAPPWSGHDHVIAQSLSRLGRRQGAEMVARVTGGKTLPDDVLDQIVAKTDGVPLFVEELTKTVLESGFLSEHDDRYTLDGMLPPLAIPATLQDSLMARLDRLSPVKEVAQIGACIGREFSHELLAAVSPLRDNELQDALQQLVNSELIHRRGMAPNATYGFKHALVQDSAYESLLKSRRQQLHQTIASVLQEQFGDQVQAEPALLAQHLTEAGDMEQAVSYWYRAGQMAFMTSAFAEASAHLHSGLSMVSRLGDEGTRKKAELDLQTLLGLCSVNMHGIGSDQAIAAFDRAETLIDHAMNAAEIIPILTAAGFYHWVKGDFPKADRYMTHLHLVSQESRDDDMMIIGNCLAGAVSVHVGRGAEGITFLEKSLMGYSGEHHRDLSIQIIGYDAGIMTSIFLTTACLWLGYLDRGLEQAHHTIAMLRDINHPVSTAAGLSLSAYGSLIARCPEPALEWAEKCIALSEAQSLPYWLGWATINRGHARGLLGDVDDGIQDLKWASDFLKSAGSDQADGWINARLAEFHMGRGELDEAEICAQALQDYVERSGEMVLEPDGYRLAGEVDFARFGAEASKAEGLFKEALRVARQQRYRLSEVRAATELGRLWQSLGKVTEARDLLAPVYDWFTEGFDTADLKDAKALLDELK